MRTSGQKEPFLDFIRELVIEMFTQHGKNPARKRNSCSGVGVDARFDGLNHWIANTELVGGNLAGETASSVPTRANRT